MDQRGTYYDLYMSQFRRETEERPVAAEGRLAAPPAS
jgi:hypothetical protein